MATKAFHQSYGLLTSYSTFRCRPPIRHTLLCFRLQSTSNSNGQRRDAPAHETEKEAVKRDNLTAGHSKFIAEADQDDAWPERVTKAQSNEANGVVASGEGRLLPTSSHLFKLVLPLPGLRRMPREQGKDLKAPPPTIFLLHPSQPLSHISSLLQAALPSPTHGPRPYNPRLPTVSFQNKSSEMPEEGEVDHQWSDSTDIGDFVKEVAPSRKFTIVITPDQRTNTAQLLPEDDANAPHDRDDKSGYEPLQITVTVPSFEDRTRYLRQRLRRLQGELKGMQEIKDSCDALARKGTRRMATGGFILLVGWWITVFRLTFFTEYGWDTMEPVTYLTEFLVIMGGYMWFLRQGREVSYTSILNQSLSSRRRVLYSSKGLDIERWAELVTEEKAIKKEIEKIRDDYEGGWKDQPSSADNEEKEVGRKHDPNVARPADREAKEALDRPMMSRDTEAEATTLDKEEATVEDKRKHVVREEEQKLEEEKLMSR